MEPRAISYLYTLATVSITFVGFSALLIVMRQAKGRSLTNYDTYFTISFIQIGFIVAASSLIPPLLALYESSLDTVWRTSSIVVAIPIFLFVSRVPARRHAATGMPVPVFVAALLALQATAAAVLCLNGLLGLPHLGATYAAAVTVVLFASGVAYLMALTVLLPEFGMETGPPRN